MDHALPQNDGRRIDRSEGEHLLFGAAQDVARRRRLLADGIHACENTSRLERGRFKLRDEQDHLIAAIPVQDARDMLAYRRQLAREILDDAEVRVNAANPPALERGKIRTQRHEVRALAWAISCGRRVPYQHRAAWIPWATTGLLLCGIVPGVAFLIWRRQLNQAYAHELEALVKRWQAAGLPEPDDSFFRLYNT